MNLKLSIKSILKYTDGKFIDTAQIGETYTLKNLVIDSRSPLIGEYTLFVILEGNKTSGAKFISEFERKGGQLVLTDRFIPSITASQLIVPNTLRALQKIAQYHREKFSIPVIGITGSNGKTTVKEWLYSVLKEKYTIIRSPKSYNSQIGVALSVLELSDNHTLAIFEAGISQPGEMYYLQKMIQPTIGVFTGIGDAHNAGFKVKDPLIQKKKEKYQLFDGVEELIAWSDSPDELTISGKVNQQIIYRSNSTGFELLMDNQRRFYTTRFFDSASNQNAALVALVASQMGILEGEIQSKLIELPIISMRLEKIEGKLNNTLISDVYNLDEKSLEIGLQYLHTTQGESKYVFLAEDEQTTTKETTLLPVIERMMEQFASFHLIYFGAKSLTKQYPFITRVYDEPSDFLEAPLAIQNAVILFTGSRNSHLEILVNAFTEKKHITRLVADLSKMRNNLNFFRGNLAAETKILAMVKAQSYGGGIIEVASFLEREHVDYFGVAYADEGIMLRKAGIKTPILVMNPEPAAFDDMIDFMLEPSIYSNALLDQFIRQLIIRQKTNFPIHIKLDTGMNRLGFRKSDLQDALDSINAQPEVYVCSVFSHLAVADMPEESDFTAQQIDNFENLCNFIQLHLGYTFIRHLSNSAGATFHSNAQYEMVRLGIGLYGLMSETLREELENVLELKSEISQTRLIESGESVGYGRDFIARKKTRIGIIPVGYADGIRRGLGHGKWSVIINQKKYPIIGRICMDMCMIDLGDDEIRAGTDVQLFGEGNSIFEMSNILGTIPYEIISSISSRVKRVYLEG